MVLASLESKLSSRSAHVAVVGLGYVGLPLALALAEQGFIVRGIDSNSEKVNELAAGASFSSEAVDQQLKVLLEDGRLSVSTDLQGPWDAAIICVPTPLTKSREPDLSAVEQAGKKLAQSLERGNLVVLESTSYPGTTREILLPLLEAGGLEGGADFHVGYSPERIDPGNQKYRMANTPKIVSGLTPTCLQLVSNLYNQITEQVVPVSSLEAAEMTKLLENIFRTVNIALVNELALLCDRLDLNIWEIVEAASTKPFGFMPFKPGPGLGGHCLPVDPFYLSWKAKEVGFYAEFIELAGKTNEAMPFFVLRKVSDGLNDREKSLKGSTIIVIGVTYKADVADIRESPAHKIIPLLCERGAKVSYHDPLVANFSFDEATLKSCALDRKTVRGADCVLILTAHSEIDYALLASEAPLIIDARNVMKDPSNANIITL